MGFHICGVKGEGCEGVGDYRFVVGEFEKGHGAVSVEEGICRVVGYSVREAKLSALS